MGGGYLGEQLEPLKTASLALRAEMKRGHDEMARECEALQRILHNETDDAPPLPPPPPLPKV